MSTTAGIDLGSEGIKGLVLTKVKRGPAAVVSAGTLPLGGLGQMADSPDKTLALGEKLKALVKSAHLKATRRRLGASGNATSIRYLHVPPVPPYRLAEMVKFDVGERTSEEDLQTYDYRILDIAETGGQYTVMTATCRERTAKELMALGRASGLREIEIDLEALALYNAYYYGHGYDQDKTVLVVDIGADDITLLLCRNGSLYFARTVMGGGRRYTQVLADELKLEFDEAEELKKTEAEITFDLPAQAPGPRPGRGPRTGPGAVLRPAPAAPAPQPAPAPAAPPPAANDTGTVETHRAAAPGPANFAAPPAEGNAGGELDLVPLDSPSTVFVTRKPAGPEMAPPATQPRIQNPAMPLQQKPNDAASADGKTPAPAPALAADTENAEVDALPPALDQLDGLPEAAPEKPEVNVEKRRKQMSTVLVREAASLCAALENAVVFCKQQSKQPQLKVDRVYVTGGGSRLKGLSEFMSRRLRMEVVSLEPFRQLSLDRLPVKEAEALKADQHLMAVAVGLALGGLEREAFTFLLWPQALKQSKVFWARGAYLYYAAGLVAASLGLGLFSPIRNRDLLAENNDKAGKAVENAKKQDSALRALSDDNEERRQQLKQIVENTQSGQYFLNILAELKSTKRISRDIYLTQLGTSLPNVVRVVNADPITGTLAGDSPKLDKNTEPDTFQAQRRVFIRGFVRSDPIEHLDDRDKLSLKEQEALDELLRKKKSVLIDRLIEFYKSLVPYPPTEDHPELADRPENLFKDIRPIWLSKEYIEDKYVLKEFVLEAYTEGTRQPAKSKTSSGKGAKAKGAKGAKPDAGGATLNAAPAAPTAPAAQPVAPVPAQPAPVPQAVPPQPQPVPAPAPAATQVPPNVPPKAAREHKFVLPSAAPVAKPVQPAQKDNP